MGRKTIIALILILSNLFIQAQNKKIDKIDYAKPKEYEIGGITISGIKYLDHNVLVQLSGLKIGQKVKVPGDKITNAIKKLWKHGLFGDIKVSVTKIMGDKIFLDIYLKERPRLSKFKFEGVSKSQADDLRDEIKLIRGSQVTDDVINMTKIRIKNYYVEKGFYNVETEITQHPDTMMPNTVILDIKIDKKQKVKIEEIILRGNEVFKDGKLYRSMKDTKRRLWYNIFKSSKFNEAKYEDDKKKLIAKYNEKGYRDAVIEYDSVDQYSDKRIKITMKIIEGKKYFFRDITWVGNTKYPSEYLSHQLGIEKGDIFDQSVLDKRLFGDENAVSALYLDKGYLFFQAVPVEIMVDNDSIDLEIRLYEGKQARINKILVTGNTRTNDHVIRREIWTKPGELFSRADIIRTQRELANLGYFNPETMDVRPVPDQANGTVDIEYVLEETPSDQIELSGGWGGDMVIGTLGLTFNNFSLKNIFDFDTYTPLPSGDGQRLSIRAQTNGKYYQMYNLSFTEPWLGGKKPNSFTVSFYHSIRNQYNWYSKSSDGSGFRTTGLTIGLGKRLNWPDNWFTLYNSLSYQYYELDNYNVFSVGFRRGYSHNINLTTVFGRNSISSPLYPRNGANIALTVQLTPPYSLFKEDYFWELSDAEKTNVVDSEDDTDDTNDLEILNLEQAAKLKFIEYYKWKFQSDWYTQIYDKLVLRTNFEFGYLGSYSDKYGDQPFESFSMGGSPMAYANYMTGTEVIPLRGYEDGTLTPGYGTYSNKQGNIYDKFSMELRYPITLNPSATIYALAFAEAGKSWDSMDELNPFDLYRSAGIGVRFFLPMFGMIGIDWGYGFDKIPGVKYDPSHFAFTIGQTF